ncbi:MAG: glycosyltransferase [Paludibacteraceae bacterium]|nr:glycosyltransferase [Paludibacteraceae bacterium]
MRLSIVVNMYNTAKYMPKCMETLLEQDIPQSEYEIILVDDCSPDNSLEMAREYAAQYKNVRVCTHEKNKGLAAARNTGIDAAKGTYLCFVDPDDYIEKNSLAVLLKQMDEEQLDMLRFNYQKVDEEYHNVPDSEIEARFDYTPGVMTGTEYLAHRLGVGCYVWAYIYRLEFVKKTGIRFFEGCFFDDTPWLPRVLQKAQRVNVNPVRHQHYLQRTGSMVHSHNKQAIMRKVDMHMQMIDILMEQKHTAPIETYDWYNMMFTHAAVSLMTSVACVDFRSSVDYYKRLKDKGIFPLSYSRASKKAIRKIKMLNTCPRLFLLMLNLKNRK